MSLLLMGSDGWPSSSFTRAFVAGAAAGAVAALALRHVLSKDEKDKAEREEVSMERTRLAKAAPRALQPELLQEQLSRNRLFFGEEGQKKVRVHMCRSNNTKTKGTWK
jgi:hypothetical protein